MQLVRFISFPGVKMALVESMSHSAIADRLARVSPLLAAVQHKDRQWEPLSGQVVTEAPDLFALPGRDRARAQVGKVSQPRRAPPLARRNPDGDVDRRL